MSVESCKGGEINSQQAEAISTLASANEYKGKSRIITLLELPWAASGSISVTNCSHAPRPPSPSCASHLYRNTVLTPAVTPKLYVAVFNDAVSQQEAATLQSQVASKLDLPEGRKGGVLIDTYFSSDENGISKLQTMIANHEIDVIVATTKTYKELSGYGYLTNLDSSLTKSQRTTLSSDFVTLKGFKDSDDPDYNGSGKGKAEPFGVSMTDFKRWGTLNPTNTDAIIGIVQESQNRGIAQQFIDYLNE